MAVINDIRSNALELLGDVVVADQIERDELTLDIAADSIVDVCTKLQSDETLAFEQLIDLCGVDYSEFAREAAAGKKRQYTSANKFAVVYHLLSVKNNHRLRLRVFVDSESPMIDSVINIWSGADWFEREAFDMFGIIFKGHPDLRRLLTDYGFIGHPFRKDFPLIGHVEMRYDEEKGRVIYQPVTIEPRVLVPRVIREEGFGDRNP